MGLGASNGTYEAKLYLCSAYLVTLSFTSNGTLGNEHTGKCQGETLIDEASIQGITVSGCIHITLFERVTSDSKWSVLSVDGALIPKSSSELKLHQGKLEIQLDTIQLDIISYTFRF